MTSTGISASLACPHGPIGATATRECRRNGVWDSPNISSCANSRITDEFTVLAEVSHFVNLLFLPHACIVLV